MAASALESIHALEKHPKSRVSFAGHGAELCLVVLFVLTAAIVCFQHQIFGRDIIVSDKTARSYALSGYSDQANGGNSSFGSAQPLAWSCDLKPGYRWLFCGYEVVLDQNGVLRGVDLRDLESVSFTIDYHGPAPTLRFSLKNEDRRYSKHGDRTTAKVNKVEFSVHNGRQTIVFRPNDFSVADWWLSGKRLAPELERTQLDDVVSAEFATGSNAPAGHYRFAIKSLSFRRSSLPPAQLYLIVLGAWAVLIPLYMLIRVQRARHDALEKERTQAQARAALASAKEAAERASKAKSDFLASMSHELRTPLNAVLGYAQLLARAKLSEEHLGAVRTIHRSGAHLLCLINDLLDLSKIEAGKMELHSAPTDVRAAVAAVVEMIGVRAEQKDLAFHCVIDEGVPETIEADEKSLRQILLNLLSNAVKFTSQGQVSLRVSLLDRDRDTATLRFEVQDSGPGIAEDELERIFRPFEQVGDIQRREGGTGLGLTISRQLAALMDGSIEVQSRVGEGARFWLQASFPVTQAPAEKAASPEVAEQASRSGSERALRILAAEDNPTNQAILRAVLADMDMQFVSNGREAVETIQQFSFDVVLMDVQMPEMSGVEATRAIRALEANSGRTRTPIVALSANVMPHQIAEYRAAGMDAHLDKPIDIEQLYRVLEKVSTQAPVDSSPVSQARLA